MSQGVEEECHCYGGVLVTVTMCRADRVVTACDEWRALEDHDSQARAQQHEARGEDVAASCPRLRQRPA
ncbi:hypothetical protein O3P69_002054 [Scylla paramamosain]|uniref:Uncharacterized protein n=1 Tax=Scylla paramamosain TaxID=85552 RepID=A0AAW0V4L3_SCYPA